jgi:hypothetical protein
MRNKKDLCGEDYILVKFYVRNFIFTTHYKGIICTVQFLCPM